ncbi:MAG: Methanogen marker protein 4 [Methanomicrobiales archaeon 53_19]|uniref:methanogenesis marker protein Mmp4/MtxX n=1 Tax=Methanocalculus sp. TaxID=2004547 RepID=UPI0007489960|nr:methanogenesis marker protein Mmp4/MtxX [Methanocalculus sp.]KUK69309.1 MAG: Methanogen marker protein 4 [Methanocalculus sp. 52_23]KUL04694.1 MAG: Methanogen marker protein 4 [Methanomicrobiales archaeon 53_19]HIJ06914.1 methanogenesis marker protein Mmp4/MtxX [Methanocalculus sp.]
MRTIGIGALEDLTRVYEASRKAASDNLFVIIYTTQEGAGEENEYVHFHISPDPIHALINSLLKGEIDGAVRGTLPSGDTLRSLREATATASLERIAVLETPEGKKFLLAPVGIDEGWTASDKVSLAKKGVALAGRIGIDTTIGVLSGGRKSDVGRNPVVDRSLAEGEHLAELTGGVHAGILIEEAANRYGIVIAPDGISGNLIFRTLVLLGSGRSHGAPVVNIDVTFVDTSRASDNYENALRLAAELSD